MRLSLVPVAAGRPIRDATAWLVGADAAAAVVAELSRRGIPLGDSRVARLPIGLFVLLPAACAAGKWPQAAAYRRLGDRVFAPVDAAGNAAVAADEWSELFPGDDLVVWHPAAGIFALPEDRLSTAADLLVPLPVERADWGRAVPGTAFNGRLLSLLPEAASTPRDLWGGTIDEIGCEPLKPGTLPRTPGELPLPSRRTVAALLMVVSLLALGWLVATMSIAPPPSGKAGPPRTDPVAPVAPPLLPPSARPFTLPPAPGLDQIGPLIGIGIILAILCGAVDRAAKVVQSAAERMTGGSRRPGRLAAGRAVASGGHGAGSWPLRRWITAPQRWLAEAIMWRHDREVRRLLRMLATDPDRGLRFAVPLIGSAPRGPAQPATGLVERPVDYGAAIGGEGSFLVISPGQRAALEKSYRMLANREIGLGHHRRAAYILAELLGDTASAAAVLLDGGHCREAAVLFEEKLGNPREAARALERGGLLSEAVLRYERIGDHEKAGELHAALGHDEESRAAYRRAVAGRLEAGDRLHAARILAEPLGAEDEALEVLAGGWPRSPQAGSCATELVRRLGRLGRHPRARDLVHKIAADGLQGEGLARLACSILPPVARGYPDEQTRRLAADQTRLLAAARLGRGAAGEDATILAALAALEPGDELLRRDTRRFPRPATAAPPQRGIVASDVRRLPEGVWTTLVSVDDTLWAAGLVDDKLAAARMIEPAGVQVATRRNWSGSPSGTGIVAGSAPVLLTVCPATARVHLHPPLGRAIAGVELLPASDGAAAMRVGSHPATALGAWAMACTPGGVLDIVRCGVKVEGGMAKGADWVWERHDAATDALQGTWRLSGIGWPPGDWPEFPSIALRGERLFIGMGDLIHVCARQGRTWSLGMPRELKGLVTSSPHTRLRLAVSFDEGGIILWGDTETAPRTPFAAGLPAPRVCLLPAGLLVAAAPGVVEVYDIRDGRATRIAVREERGLDPAAVAPRGGASGSAAFAILDAGGTLRCYDVRV